MLFVEVKDPTKGYSYFLDPNFPAQACFHQRRKAVLIREPQMADLKDKHADSYSPSPTRSFLPEDEIPEVNFLEPKQVQMINEALCTLGDYGEVRLIVEKGRLRYLIMEKSVDVFKWQPGTLVKDMGK
jgi:hypothetical protein